MKLTLLCGMILGLANISECVLINTHNGEGMKDLTKNNHQADDEEKSVLEAEENQKVVIAEI